MLMEYQGKPGVMGTLIDVSDRKRAAERLREVEALLEKRVGSKDTPA
jgi:hypothetical protein